MSVDMSDALNTQGISGGTGRLTLADALNVAIQLHRSGRMDDALELYQRIVEAMPELPEGWHFRGMLHFQQGRHDQGVADLRHSLELSPDYADAHANLANMLIESEQYAEAETHLDHALRLAPDAIPPRVALALIYRRSGRAAEAVAMLRPAADRSPDDAGLQYGLANALMAMGEAEQSVDHYLRAVVLRPDIGSASRMLGYALCKLGRVEEAAAYFRQRLEKQPDDAEAQHMLAACGAVEAPARADDAYVRCTFDKFAASFESQLARIGYRAPELIAAATAKCLPPTAARLAVLDAGCGTGLLGPLLKPWSATLSGVDLSPGMLQRARQRGIYDTLIEGELGAFLRDHPAHYDLVASADTLCYFGALEEVVQHAGAALKPGGLFLFTVEDGGEQLEGYALQFHGRYAHRRDYVVRALEQADFHDLRLTSDTLRSEAGRPVAGLVVTARKGGTPCP